MVTNRAKATDAETCWSYFEFANTQPMGWAHFVGLPRGGLVDHRRKKSKPPPEIVRLYEWIDGDELVSDDPILRAATLLFGLQDSRRGTARTNHADGRRGPRAASPPRPARGSSCCVTASSAERPLRPTAPGFGYAQTTGDLTPLLRVLRERRR